MVKLNKVDDLILHVFDYDIVLFAMGVNNSMNNGFLYDIALNFCDIKKNENNMPYGDKRRYGNIHNTRVRNTIFIACYCLDIKNCVREEDLITCFKKIKQRFKGKTIACVNIFDDVEKYISIFDNIFKDTSNVTIFTNVCYDRKKQFYCNALEYKHKLLEKEITKDEYTELMRVNEWQRNNGFYNEIPSDYIYEGNKKGAKKLIIRKKT